MPVIVTETAAREVDSIIQQQELDAATVKLRVGVKGGGCSGFSYLLDLTEVQKDTDEIWDYTFRKNGTKFERIESAGDGNVAVAEADTFTLRVVCDPKSYLYLNGTTIDFKESIMGRGFVFENPNATSTCGCGSSFSG
ncbi:MAG: iron-sulfur cluster assembly accessory protein [Phycisphaerae bacterium]|nr:iron-sulfur cluster assembly accessory protein [Phycisphaerae bacterium]